jgi:transposase InsO family protein
MPWKDCTVLNHRLEFVVLASQPGANMSLLCRRFGIARKNGYKWLQRYQRQGAAGLADQSRRPATSPVQTSPAMEEQVVALRRKYRVWGPRKLARRLEDLQVTGVPAASTVAAILRRHGLIDPEDSRKHQPMIRFEHPAPNDLWQMDFKGHFALAGGGRCHPLTVLDDHSRYNLVLQACHNEQGQTVREHLICAFERYGLPKRILSDNGSPWGTSGGSIAEQWTPLTVWLLQLNIRVYHGRPYHPQTQGKEERFHRTLREELLQWHAFADCRQVQSELDPWRRIYNHERPHEGIAMQTPAQRYQPSVLSYPRQLPPMDYGSGQIVRQVTSNASIRFAGQRYMIGKAFRGHAVALRPTTTDGLHDVYFCHQQVGQLDQRTGTSVGRRRCVGTDSEAVMPTPASAQTPENPPVCTALAVTA